MTAKERWIDGIRAVHDAAGGLLAITVIRPEDTPLLLGAAMNGDIEAQRLLVTVSRAKKAARSAPSRKPVLCGCCPKPLRKNFTVAIATADQDNPERAIAFGLCDRCTGPGMDVSDQVLTALRVLFPHARQVTVTPGHAAGHA